MSRSPAASATFLFSIANSGRGLAPRPVKCGRTRAGKGLHVPPVGSEAGDGASTRRIGAWLMKQRATDQAGYGDPMLHLRRWAATHLIVSCRRAVISG